MNIAQALAVRGEVDSYERQENAWLLAHILQCSATQLKLMLDDELSDAQHAEYLQGLQRIAAGEPLAYVLGSQPFWTLDLIVSKETLVPRPDTEILVETALQLAVPRHSQVLDLGTGTGAIALSLASERADWQVFATDIAEETLAVAQANAKKHGLNDVQFFCGSWFDALAQQSALRFDLIVSNPPYIAEDDEHLTALQQEPRRALVAKNQGLADLEHIIQQSVAWLKHGAWLVLEHGYQQGKDVQALLQQAGFSQVRTVKDYAGQDRVSLGRWL
ncbi:MAG: peptide chain release factor N(5)-glutamine methyltransferase [Acinetobacter sp.]|nr:peptide chain release factor N(5)-glutamine methyltransferase [Acinetobacter sp.]